jgi:hypothetical protein
LEIAFTYLIRGHGNPNSHPGSDDCQEQSQGLYACVVEPDFGAVENAHHDGADDEEEVGDAGDAAVDAS